MNYKNLDENINKTPIRTIFTGTFNDEESTFNELGIELKNVFEGSKLIFNIFEEASHEFIENPDLIGPLILIFIYTFFLILKGKLHFGYIYFLSLFSVFFMYFLFNVITDKKVSFSQVGCIMGYSFGPVIFYSLLDSFLTKKLKILFSICFSFWSALTSTSILCEYLNVNDKKFLFLYPMIFMYFAFCCLVIF